ncbi:MAG: radical SAM family heme chaperone HemW [Aquificaceae bacterium]|jgi:oxygen-independent coproporphyrinogen-3 oxidase|uniref:radical SAM family heme chaperone HemW n=1 Tax=Hydrogenobacter sp. Uz 6-8 TaxID=3384828 RepID=UPI000F2BDB37|nr:MAG: radical SAM family heme chaperone HemW [Aquificota bacterium]
MVKGLYFHIPFCSYKCPYCDFVSVVDPVLDPSEYMNMLLKELELYRNLHIKPQTLYFGGGTPSLIKPELYESFFERLFKYVDSSNLEEVSIECNPENYILEDYRRLKDAGFNRVSIGVQSLREEGLRALGRLHSVETSLRAVEFARVAGFENINIDLIYGYHGQSLKDLEKELKILRSLPISHVSFYLLTPYEDTQLGRLYEKGLLELPEEDTIGDMYELICESLEGFGFLQYEVSNFSLPGYQCRHNMLYWSYEEFLGLGVSAWSFVDRVRFGNTKNLRLYAERVSNGEKPVEYEEKLEGDELLYDYLFVALRTSKGVEKSLLSSIPRELEEFFEVNEDRLRLKRRGFLLINEVLWRLRQAILLKA